MGQNQRKKRCKKIFITERDRALIDDAYDSVLPFVNKYMK